MRKQRLQEWNYLLRATWVVRSGIRIPSLVGLQGLCSFCHDKPDGQANIRALNSVLDSSLTLSWASRGCGRSGKPHPDRAGLPECHQSPPEAGQKNPALTSVFLIWIPAPRGPEMYPRLCHRSDIGNCGPVNREPSPRPRQQSLQMSGCVLRCGKPCSLFLIQLKTHCVCALGRKILNYKPKYKV